MLHLKIFKAAPKFLRFYQTISATIKLNNNIFPITNSLNNNYILKNEKIETLNIHMNNLNIREQKLPTFNIQKEIFELPIFNNPIIENPLNNNKQITEINLPERIIEKNNEIQLARLIVIRKRKMKKHKLKKLRKRMKFEWAKVRQRREMRKEKAFQAELLMQIKNTDKFSAEKFVEDKLREFNENPIPRFWKGRRLPQFIIKEKLGIK